MRSNPLAALIVVTALSLPLGLARAADPAPATRPSAKATLKAALSPGADLLNAGKADACRKLYADTCAAAVQSLGAETDAGTVLSKALSDAKRAATDEEAVETLSAGMNEAMAAIDFKPISEAALPKGFPPPGPVGEVVVKRYPAYRLARTPMAGGVGQNGAFGVLFRHIQTNKIEMTAPVEMSYEKPAGAGEKPSAVAMAFLYESPEIGRLGKDAQAANVEVIDAPAATFASVGVRGNYTPDRMAEGLVKLDAWLAQHAKEYARAGEPRYLGYNSPFVLPWMRYGEVQVPVRREGRE